MITYNGKVKVKPLSEISTEAPTGLDKKVIIEKTAHNIEQIAELQTRLFAERKQTFLLIFQGMDGSGKDSVTKHVIGQLNPQSIKITGFKAPEPSELAHDFLWRIHKEIPPYGYLGVFNRSHYEEVLIVRIEKLVEESVWHRYFDQINDFEKMLSANSIVIRKIYLHISKEVQRLKLEERKTLPEKQWKYDPNDEIVHKKWKDYQEAYEDAFKKCSTEDAPWHIVPADDKWYRDNLITEIILTALKDMDPKYPRLSL